MKPVRTLLLCGALAPCFALALSGAAVADSAAHAPWQLGQVAQNDNQNATYQERLQTYQEQQRLYQAQKQNYDAQASRYAAARDRYRDQRARYHRFGWPAHYEHSIIAEKGELLGAPVQTYRGHTVGHVEELALSPSGHVDAIRVTLNRNDRNVWIESADLRFDADARIVMTNLDRDDLYVMSNETY